MSQQTLAAWIRTGRERGASDVHVEPGLPLALRIAGRLVTLQTPVPARAALDEARALMGQDGWRQFLTRRSFDASRVIEGVRCRVNVLQSARGVGLSIRLLGRKVPTIEGLNLHPDLAALALAEHGLVLICGTTGSGKSSTLAALVEHLNRSRARHVITVEQPIEHWFTPRKCYIRQREVGRDTPTFEQALIDAMREDPDVIVVGEMRHPETMRLTLDAAETGHLVMATMHASSPAEAIARVVSSFAPEAQPGVRAQLAGCMRAVIHQSLAVYPGAGGRVPELQILANSTAVSAHIRDGATFKLASAVETGSADGSTSLSRYRRWLQSRTQWANPDVPGGEPAPVEAPRGVDLPSLQSAPATSRAPLPGRSSAENTGFSQQKSEPVLVLDDGSDIDDIIAQLNKR